MVQVDVFWSYAIGAGFAAAAARQIKDEPTAFRNEYYMKNLLYLALLFAPSGVVLLWAFTGWETMYFWGKAGRLLPAWLVPIFCITNVTQGILGFWVAHKLIKKGKLFWAHAQWIFGYLFMFFILVHGWDGMGWRRFFTYTPHQTAEVLDMGFGPWIALKWATTSPVAWTLYGMGVIMLPVMFYWLGKWAVEGYRLGGVDRARVESTTMGGLVKVVCKVVFVWTLGSAIVWSLLIHLLGWGFGTLIFAVAYAFLGFGPNGFYRKDIDRITLQNGAAEPAMGVTVPAK